MSVVGERIIGFKMNNKGILNAKSYRPVLLVLFLRFRICEMNQKVELNHVKAAEAIDAKPMPWRLLLSDSLTFC